MQKKTKMEEKKDVNPRNYFQTKFKPYNPVAKAKKQRD